MKDRRSASASVAIVLFSLSGIFAGIGWVLKPEADVSFAQWVADASTDDYFRSVLLTRLVEGDSSWTNLPFADSLEDGIRLGTEIALIRDRNLAEYVLNSSTQLINDYAIGYRKSFWMFRISMLLAIAGTVYSIVLAFSTFWSQTGYVPKAGDDIEKTREKVIADMRYRAANLRNQSAVVLLAIAGACFTSFMLFYTADDLLSAAFDDAVYQLDSSFEGLQESVDDLSDDVRLAINEIADMDSGSTASEASVAVISSLSALINSNRFAELSSIPSQAMVVVREGEDQIVSTLLVRVGSIIISIFILFMLAPTYRYAMNMSAFYESRADSLALASISEPDELRLLIDQLSPPQHSNDAFLMSLLSRSRKAKDGAD